MGRNALEAIFDAHWRRQAIAGSTEAVTALAEEAIRPLYRFCFYRVGQDPDVCEDVVQETLTRAIRELHKYDPSRSKGNIFSWLTGLARNEVRRALRGRRSAQSLEALWERMDRELLNLYARLAEQPFDEEVLRRTETRELVNATMSQLPPHYGSVLEERYVESRSVRDLAAALEISEKAVESLLSRAREAFRATFLALTHSLTLETNR